MAVDIFFRLGDNIKGEALADGKDAKGKDLKGQMEVLSWNWGMSQSDTTTSGTGAGAGKVEVHHLTLSKYVDLASNELVKACCAGTHFDKAQLTVRKAGGTAMIYYSIEFDKVFVTSVSIAGTQDDRLQETVSIKFKKFSITYTKQDDAGRASGSTTATFDIALNKAS